MAEFSFETLRFIDNGESVRFVFMTYFYFDAPKLDLSRIGDFTIDNNTVTFDCPQKRAENKLHRLLQEGFNSLKHLITKKPVTYAYRGSGIPLIGNNSFGIVDRNTNIIELKPITGCNLDCIYCSVSDEYRLKDFLVEEEYLVEELKKLLDYKQCDYIEAHIGVQGEPLFYFDLVRLVADLKNIPWIKRITMDTNATMLSKEMVDKLIDAGMTRFNISINSLSADNSKKIAGSNYNIDHIKSIVEYIAKKDRSLVHIAPVVMYGVNEKDMGELVRYAKSLGIPVWIQNFLEYGGGKKPVKEKDWDYFRNFLKELEQKYDMKLLLDFKRDFGLKETKELAQVCEIDKIIVGEYVCEGRLPNEIIVAYKGRSITVINTKNKPLTLGQSVKCRITSIKHNMARADQL